MKKYKYANNFWILKRAITNFDGKCVKTSTIKFPFDIITYIIKNIYNITLTVAKIMESTDQGVHPAILIIQNQGEQFQKKFTSLTPLFHLVIGFVCNKRKYYLLMIPLNITIQLLYHKCSPILISLMYVCFCIPYRFWTSIYYQTFINQFKYILVTGL